MVGQQATGINCIIFYAESIFADAGLTDASLSSILLGLTQVVGTALASSLMDKAGRRFWLFLSKILMIIFLVIFGTYQNYQIRNAGPDWLEYLGLVSVLAFSLSFALGEGEIDFTLRGLFLEPKTGEIGTGTNCLFEIVGIKR
jgi:MFS family permease